MPIILGIKKGEADSYTDESPKQDPYGVDDVTKTTSARKRRGLLQAG